MYGNWKQNLNSANPAFNPTFNPYYAGARFPRHNPTEVYNVRMPFAYPQPQPPEMRVYRPLDHGQRAEQVQKKSPESLGKESVDPPSEKMSPVVADDNMPPTGGFGMRLGMGVRSSVGGRNIFQRMFNRDAYQFTSQNTSPVNGELPSEDIHAWRRKIPVGRAPTPVQKNRPRTYTRPTIANTFGRGTAYDPARPWRVPDRWWERLMSTRQTDEQSMRKKLRLPDPASPRFPSAPYLRDRIREKEEKRRQRAGKRNERQRPMAEQSKSAQLSRGALERTDERD
ncbi:hypothetical protein I310_04579 [Cryptococcus deuterogattii CA1014]|nr:hypothetical protein I310_04579 [Cryptococcus deuterogattii CA1014]